MIYRKRDAKCFVMVVNLAEKKNWRLSGNDGRSEKKQNENVKRKIRTSQRSIGTHSKLTIEMKHTNMP